MYGPDPVSMFIIPNMIIGGILSTMFIIWFIWWAFFRREGVIEVECNDFNGEEETVFRFDKRAWDKLCDEEKMKLLKVVKNKKK